MSFAELERKIDSIMAEFVSPNGPGAAVLIGRDDKVLYRKAFGLANVEKREQLTPDHRFIMASVTKQFTCTAIMVLKRQGLLSYDEPISRFFPDYPEWKNAITVRHLMNQVSGLQEYLTGEFWKSITESGNSVTLPALLDAIGKFEELEFTPGSKWRYCNTNYILLGSIVEKVSGKSFRDFMQEYVLDPAGMKDSFAGDSGEMAPRQTYGYFYKGKDDFKRAPFNAEVVGWADGNLISTVDDMFLWAQALSSDKVLPLSEKALSFVPWNPLDPSETRYGFGQFMGERRGIREIHHSGGTLGFNTRISRWPDEKLCVIVLSNAAGIGVESILGEITEVLLGDKMVPLKPVELPEECLIEKVGKYSGKPRNGVLKVEVAYSTEKKALTFKRYEESEGLPSSETTDLIPLGRDLFLMNQRADRYLQFTREHGEVSGVRILSVGSVTNIPAKAV